MLVVAGCDDGAPLRPGDAATPAIDAGPPAALPDGVPCEAGEVIARRCLRCHADPPRFGAPMPLTDRDAFLVESSVPGEPVHARALDRVQREGAGRMPPPSQPPLSAEELAALTEWLDDGAPAAAETCDEPVVPPGDCVGPECLPCAPTHTFLAEGDAPGEPYHVPAGGNPYRCVAFPSPFSPGDQATAWAPIIDDERVVHHWILFRTATEPDLGDDCQMPLDAVGLMGWAPGGENAVLPDEVGLELAQTEGEWLILQMHYWNVAGHDDAFDRSGVAVCRTESPRANTAAVVTLGTTAVAVPPRARDAEVAASCPSASTLLLSSPLNVLSATPHMHRLGSRIRTEIHRAGSPLDREELIRVDPWGFDDQRAYWFDEPIEIRPGDALVTHCTYDNPSGEWAYFGERSEDEMCFDFLLVYPIEAWPRGYGRTCMTAIGL